MAHTRAFERFLKSMQLDYDKWHDGIGYDVDALGEMPPRERKEIVAILTQGPQGVT